MVRRRAPADFAPRWVTEVELAEPVAPLRAPRRGDGATYAQAQVLARLHAQPLGLATVPLADGAASVDVILEAVRDQLPGPLADHLRADEILPGALTGEGLEDSCHVAAPKGAQPFASVVVCTRDRAESLRRALRSVLAMDYPDFELVVVDNAPRTSATRDVVAELADSRVRYVLEPRPGLSCARNQGVAEARGEIVAFTDDDVVADVGWLAALVAGFGRAPHVGAVTGLVPGAEIETAAQAYFETKLDWAEVFEARVYDLGEHRADHPAYPYSAGHFGAGANFAATRSTLAKVGPFDEALGAGTPSRGGEDLDYFLRVILGGCAIAFEPAALVWHVHRREEAVLVQQMYGYGSGLTAYLVKHMLITRGAARTVLGALPRAVASFAKPFGTTRSATAVPPGAMRKELEGLVAGPVLYLRGRRR